MPINATGINYELPNAKLQYRMLHTSTRKTNASLQPPMSSLPPRNIIHLQTCTTGTHHQNTRSAPTLNPSHIHTFGCTTYIMDANYRTAKSSTNGPNNFSKLLNPTCSPLELYFPSALDSHHYHFTYNMTTVPKPSGTNSPSPNGTTNATLIFHQRITRQTTQPTTKNTSTKQLNS
jgi:hypothetical protein